MITRQDIVAATPNVLKRLQTLATLPSHGTVAGQAVASLFYEELGIGVSGPINDVDLFVSYTLPPQERAVVYTQDPNTYIRKERANRTASNVNDMAAEVDDYVRIKFICARSNVTIFRTYQDGLRNFTLINHKGVGDNGEQTIDVSQDIVDGFDLNLVGVGIHLDSGKAVVTDAFMAFLNHKSIQVVTCNTPTHTLIRLAKKVHSGEIVGASCNYNGQREILETHLAVVDQERTFLTDTFGVVVDIGEKYRAIAQTYAQYLPPLTKKLENHEVTLYGFDPKFLQPSPVIKDIQKLIQSSNTLGHGSTAFLACHTFVANFPRVFALASERLNGHVDYRWELLSNAVNNTIEMSDGWRLDGVNTALFDTKLIDQNLEMDNADAAVFFFKHPDLDDEQRTHIVAQYQSFNFGEKIVFHHHFSRSTDVQNFIDNKQHYIDEFLLSRGLIGLIEMAQGLSKIDIDPLVARVFSLMEQNPKFTADVSHNLHSPYFDRQSTQLFEHYSIDEKHELFCTLLKSIGIDVDHLPAIRHTAVKTLGLAYCNGLWHENWMASNLHEPMSLFFTHASDTPSYGDGEWGKHATQIAFIEKGLNILNDDQLLKDNAIVLRNILVPQHYTVVRDRLLKIPNQTELVEYMSTVAQATVEDTKVFPYLCKGQPTGTLWSKLQLDLSTVEFGASKSKRKM